MCSLIFLLVKIQMFKIIDEFTSFNIGTQISKNFIIGHLSSGAFHYLLGQWIPQFTMPLNSILGNFNSLGGIIPGLNQLTSQVDSVLSQVNQITGQIDSALSQVNQIWQVAQNLQVGSLEILDDVLSKFGDKLILRSALQALNFGKSFEIQIKGYQNNMFNIVKEVQNIVKKAESFELIQGKTSFLRIKFDPKNMSIRTDIPIYTKDVINKKTLEGLQSVKGFT